MSLVCQMNRMIGDKAQNQVRITSSFPAILEPYTVGIQTNVRALLYLLMEYDAININVEFGIGVVP